MLPVYSRRRQNDGNLLHFTFTALGGVPLVAMSLGFHIIFAVVGIGMPLLMVVAEWRWRRSGNGIYLELAAKIGKSFATGS